MKKYICPRCGSTNIDWIIPQVWSKWVCKECDYTGPAIEGEEKLANEIKEEWIKNKDKILKEDLKNEDEELSDEDLIYEDDDELSDEEIDKKLEELNL